MAEEIIFKVGVDTGNSAEDLKKIDDELKKVNEDAEKLGNKSAAEFAKLNEKVTLGNLSLKESAKAVKDYMAIAAQAGHESPIGMEALKAAQELKDKIGGLGNEVKTSQQKFEDLNKKVEAGGLTMRESAKAVKEYMSIALAAGRESPIGKAALLEAANMQDSIGDLKEEVSNLAHDGKNMQGALQLGGAVASGYGLVQGTMALMGSESEDLQKSMQKLMAVTTVLNSVEQIRVALEKQSSLMIGMRKVQTAALAGVQFLYTAAVGSSSIALQGLNKSIMGIPIIGWILALVAALIGLVAMIVSLMKEEDNSKEVSENLTKAYDKQKEAIDRVSKARLKGIDNMIRQRMEEGASIEEIGKLEIARIKEEEAARKANVKTEKEAIDKKNANYKNALKHGNYELAKSIREEVNEHRTKYKELVGLEGQFGTDLKYQKTKTANDIKDREEKDTQEAADKQKAANEKSQAARVKADEKKAEYAKTMQDLVIANIVNENERAIAAMGLAPASCKALFILNCLRANFSSSLLPFSTLRILFANAISESS